MSQFRPRLTLKKAMLVVAISACAFAAFNAVGDAREAAQRSQCTNNLKQIGLALHNYHFACDMLPCGTDSRANLPTEQRTSWAFVVIPYLEQMQGEFEYDYNEPWDSPINLTLYVSGVDIETKRPFRYLFGDHPCFRCPSNPTKSKPNQVGDTHITGIAGLGIDAATLPQGDPRAGVFGYDRATKFSDITDGLANTMLVAETTQNNGPWTAGGPISVRGLDPEKPPYIGGKKGQFGGTHPGGANVLFADGSVKFVRETIAPKTFEALSTISGGEPAPNWP